MTRKFQYIWFYYPPAWWPNRGILFLFCFLSTYLFFAHFFSFLVSILFKFLFIFLFFTLTFQILAVFCLIFFLFQFVLMTEKVFLISFFFPVYYLIILYFRRKMACGQTRVSNRFMEAISPATVCKESR